MLFGAAPAREEQVLDFDGLHQRALMKPFFMFQFGWRNLDEAGTRFDKFKADYRY